MVVPESSWPEPVEMIGQSLGRYRLVGELTDAGPGVVYRAEDTLVERRVALQLVPSAAAAEPERLDRIRTEVERAAAFVHPDVATLYGLEEADGRWFVTMALTEGRPLDELLSEARMPLGAALGIAASLADVLAGAKEAGVVHGRLHPGELLLAADGSIRVRGFGLDELRRAAAEADPTERDPAAAYRPPELQRGIRPDHRADLFALALLVRRMIDESEAPPELEQLLGSCLSEAPVSRPQSASELRLELEKLRGELFRDRHAAPAEEAPETVAGRRFGHLRTLAAGALLALAAVWGLWWSFGRSQPAATEEPAAVTSPVAAPRDLAVIPLDNRGAVESQPLAIGFTRELTRLLERQPGLSVIAADSAAAAAADGTSALELGRRLGAAQLLRGSFLWQRDSELSRLEVEVQLLRLADATVLWSGGFGGYFGEVVDLQGEIAAAVASRLGAAGGERPPVTARLEAYLSYLEAVGRSAGVAAPEELRAAAAGLAQATLLDPRFLEAYTRRAQLELALHAAEPTAGHLVAARDALAAARGIDPEDSEVLRAAAELAALAGGDPEVTRSKLVAALERLPGDSGLLRALAMIDRREGRWDEAADGLAAALRQDPRNLELLGQLVETLARTRRFDAAMRTVDAAVASAPDALEPLLLRADLEVRSRGAVGAARAILEGMPEEASSDPRWQRRMRTVELFEGDYGSVLTRLAPAGREEPQEMIERAWVHHHMRSRLGAEADFERARKLLEARLASAANDPALHAALGQAYAGTGRSRAGIGRGQRASALEPVTGDAFAGPELVELLARTYVLAGDTEHALDELTFLLEIPSPVSVALLRLDPVWEPLREHPRFRSLLEHYGG